MSQPQILSWIVNSQSDARRRVQLHGEDRKISTKDVEFSSHQIRDSHKALWKKISFPAD